MSHRRMLAGLLLWTMMAVGCGEEPPDEGRPDAGQVEQDSGLRPPPRDSGPECSARDCTDAGPPPQDGGQDCNAALCTDAGVPPVDAGTDAGQPEVDAGTDAGMPPVDAGTDAGQPEEDAGVPPVDAGTDAGQPGQDAGTDGGTPEEDAGTDAGLPPRPTVLRTEPAPESSGADVKPVVAIRFSEPMRGEDFDRDAFILVDESSGAFVEGSIEAAGEEASFRPRNRLTLLGRYMARVSSSVSSSRGVPLGQSHRWSFRVRDGEWRQEARLGSLPKSDYPPRPHVAFDSEGRALAIWAGSDGTRHGVWVREHFPGEGWREPETLGPVEGEEALTPQVVTGPRGRALAVWFQRRPPGQAFPWFSTRRPDGTWTAPARVDPSGFGDGTTLQLTVDARGRALIAWTQFDFDTFSENVWTAGLDLVSGTQWSRAQRIDVDEFNYTFDLKLAMNAAGEAVAVWTRFDGARGWVWARRYTPGEEGVGTWGPPAWLNSDDTEDATMPAVALAEDGTAMAVWMQYDAQFRYTVFARPQPREGEWGEAQSIDLTEGGHAIEPAALHLRDGHVLAVWSKYDGARNNIAANHFQPGEGWGGPRLLEEDDVDSARHPVMARDAAGNALVAWDQADGARGRARAARYVWGEGWRPASVLGAEAGTGSAGPPNVGLGPDGRGFACWAETDGTEDHAVIVPFD